MATNQFRVNLFPRDAADCIYNYVVHGSITGTLIDNYTVYESNGVAVWLWSLKSIIIELAIDLLLQLLLIILMV